MPKSTSTTTRRSRSAPNPLRDYTERWPKPTNSLWKRNDDVDAEAGPAWYARCNEHGTLAPAANVKEADVLGRKAQRVEWCSSCRDAAMPAPAKPKARTRKQAEADDVAAAIADGSADKIVETAKAKRTRKAVAK